MAAPAIPPTTPPTTTGVDGVLAFELPPLPDAAVVVDALPVLPAVPPAIPPPVLVATTDVEELGE